MASLGKRSRSSPTFPKLEGPQRREQYEASSGSLCDGDAMDISPDKENGDLLPMATSTSKATSDAKTPNRRPDLTKSLASSAKRSSALCTPSRDPAEMLQSLQTPAGRVASNSDDPTIRPSTTPRKSPEDTNDIFKNIITELQFSATKSPQSCHHSILTHNTQTLDDFETPSKSSLGITPSGCRTATPDLFNVSKRLADDMGFKTPNKQISFDPFRDPPDTVAASFMARQILNGEGLPLDVDSQMKAASESPVSSSLIESAMCVSVATAVTSVSFSSRGKCQFDKCQQVTQSGTSFCLEHCNVSRRCREANCDTEVQGQAVFCKQHGGTRRCQMPSCTKSSQNGTRFCIAHGGGRRCQFQPHCSKSAVGQTEFCVAHGGGRRCKTSECTKSAVGKTDFCRAHGGGLRCEKEDCGKSAQNGTKFCIAHGGGKRCRIEDCPKSAVGQTDLCVAHGGGRRCSYEDCEKSSVGRTEYCKLHGGGKRCRFEGCKKNIKPKSEFCFVHAESSLCQHPDCQNTRAEGRHVCWAHEQAVQHVEVAHSAPLTAKQMLSCASHSAATATAASPGVHVFLASLSPDGTPPERMGDSALTDCSPEWMNHLQGNVGQRQRAHHTYPRAQSSGNKGSLTPVEFEKAKIRFADETPASQAKTPSLSSAKYQLLSPTPIDPYIGPHDEGGVVHLQGNATSVSPLVGNKSTSCVASPQSEASSDSVSDFFAQTKSADASPNSVHSHGSPSCSKLDDRVIIKLEMQPEFSSTSFKSEVQQLDGRFQRSAHLGGSHPGTITAVAPTEHSLTAST